ncbi:MAG: hypothetical protein R6X06_12570 [Gammaproteobacteria bacterium]
MYKKSGWLRCYVFFALEIFATSASLRLENTFQTFSTDYIHVIVCVENSVQLPYQFKTQRKDAEAQRTRKDRKSNMWLKRKKSAGFIPMGFFALETLGGLCVFASLR